MQKALEILTDVIANGNTVQSVLAEGEFIEKLLSFLSNSLNDLINVLISIKIN